MKDKVVVITGASKGLGKELARFLVQRGAQVVVSARTGDELEAAAHEVGATAIVADAASEVDTHALVRDVVQKFGRIDVWINNAGIWMPHGPVEELDMERVKQMFDVNVYGLMYGSKEALIQMKKQGSGMIVNIVSSSALSGRPRSSAYAASKWAARGFTDSLREEIKGTPLKVVGVYPGGMKTHLFDEHPPEDYHEYMEASDVAQKIVDNFEQESPQEEQIIRRPA